MRFLGCRAISYQHSGLAAASAGLSGFGSGVVWRCLIHSGVVSLRDDFCVCSGVLSSALSDSWLGCQVFALQCLPADVVCWVASVVALWFLHLIICRLICILSRRVVLCSVFLVVLLVFS